MKGKNKYLLKNIGIMTLSKFSSKILVFLLVPLYTSILSTEEYGTYDLIISTVQLLYPILCLNIADATLRYVMDKNYDKKGVFNVSLWCVSAASIVFSILVLIIGWSSIFQGLNGLWGLIICYFALSSFGELLAQYAKGQEKVFDLGVAGILSTAITIIANILFLVVFKWRMKGFLFATVLALFSTNLYYVIRLKIWKEIKYQKVDKVLLKSMLTYCLPLLFSVVAWWVNSGSDKYVVTFFCGVAANGVLSVAYKIPSVLNTLQGIFIQAWQISAIKEYGENDTAVFYGQTFVTVNLLMCVACSWLIILTKPLAQLLYAKDFYVAWQYVPFLLIASVLNCASGLLGPILSAQKNSKAMMWSAIIGAGANIILNITLVYIIGIQGATIATVICSYIIYAVRKIAVGKDITIEHYETILLTWFLLSIQATVEIYVGKWWIEIFIMIVLLIINAPTLKKLIASMRGIVESVKSKMR